MSSACGPAPWVGPTYNLRSYTSDDRTCYRAPPQEQLSHCCLRPSLSLSCRDCRHVAVHICTTLLRRFTRHVTRHVKQPPPGTRAAAAVMLPGF